MTASSTPSPSLEALRAVIDFCVQAQHNATANWHHHEPDEAPQPESATASPEHLHDLVLAQHQCNFRLWHVEDTARRRDVDDTVIADCKRRIDGLNQRRNDGMERVDACLNALLGPLMPAATDPLPINTESPGMAMDRLSILSLKIWHMAEQVARTDVNAEHVATCRGKLAVLDEQRRDLHNALNRLLEDYAAGRKTPKVYYQCKMYNDPALNPELYSNKR